MIKNCLIICCTHNLFTLYVCYLIFHKNKYIQKIKQHYSQWLILLLLKKVMKLCSWEFPKIELINL
nr:MAG TPA: hypothetical protein [Bacteriophage sp.]DAY42097.1 MAG TPA: hypothetical protein [Caudoviricetes sp.]